MKAMILGFDPEYVARTLQRIRQKQNRIERLRLEERLSFNEWYKQKCEQASELEKMLQEAIHLENELLRDRSNA